MADTSFYLSEKASSPVSERSPAITGRAYCTLDKIKAWKIIVRTNPIQSCHHKLHSSLTADISSAKTVVRRSDRMSCTHNSNVTISQKTANITSKDYLALSTLLHTYRHTWAYIQIDIASKVVKTNPRSHAAMWRMWERCDADATVHD